MDISTETLRKLLAGLKGDKRSKSWGVNFLEGHLAHEARNTAIRKLTEEWLQQFVREVQWDDPSFQHLKGSLLEMYNDNKGEVIADQVHNLAVDTIPWVVWDTDLKQVVWSHFAHHDPCFKAECLPQLLAYVNEHLDG